MCQSSSPVQRLDTQPTKPEFQYQCQFSYAIAYLQSEVWASGKMQFLAPADNGYGYNYWEDSMC